MPAPLEELMGRLNRLDDKFKLNNLQIEKRFADLELNLGKLQEKFKDVWATIPDLKERTQTIEDLLNVVNVGLEDFKKRFEEVNSRVIELEKVPGKVEEKFSSFSKNLKVLEGDVKKMSQSTEELSSAANNMAMVVQREVLPDVKFLKDSMDKNNVEVEQLKEAMHNLKLTVEGLQKSVDMMDIGTMLRQFDSVNYKIISLQQQFSRVKDTVPNKDLFDNDVNLLEGKIQGLNTNLINTNANVKGLEASVKALTDKLKKLKVGSQINSLKGEIKDNERMILENELKIENLKDEMTKRNIKINDKLDSLGNLMKKSKHLGFIESMSEEMRDQAEVMSDTKDEVKDLSHKIEKMYYDLNKRMDKLRDAEKFFKEFGSRMNALERELKKNRHELEIFKKKDYEEMISKEVASMKKIMADLMEESKDVRKAMSRGKVVGVEGVGPRMVAEMINRINDLERRVEELSGRAVSKAIILE